MRAEEAWRSPCCFRGAGNCARSPTRPAPANPPEPPSYEAPSQRRTRLTRRTTFRPRFAKPIRSRSWLRSRSPLTSSPPTDVSARAPPRCGRRRWTRWPPPAPPSSAPPTARPRSRTWSARSARASRELFSLPEGYEVVLGNGGSTAFWDIATHGLIENKSPAPDLRRVQLEVRQGREARPLARRADRRSPPTRARTRSRWPRRASTSTPSPTTRPRPVSPPRSSASPGADEGSLVLVDATSGAGGLPVDIAETDVYYFAPQKSFASDGGLWIGVFSPAAHRARRARSTLRPPRPGVLQPADGDRQLPQEPDVQHPGPRHPLPAERAAGVDQRPGRPGLVTARRTASSPAPVQLGRGVQVRDPVRRGPGQALPGHRHDRLLRRDRRRRRRQGPARQRHRRHRALPQARPQPAPRRDVPGDRPGGRRGPDEVRRLRDREAVTASLRGAGARRTPGAFFVRGLTPPYRSRSALPRPGGAPPSRGPDAPAGSNRRRAASRRSRPAG